MSDDLTAYPTQRVRLQPCNICGRQFNVESLKKHQAICRKVTNTKRKVFDAGKQRAQDSDVSYKATKRTAQIYKGEVRPQDEKSKSKSNWRQKHAQLIQSIREARSVTRAMKEGGPLPAFRPSEVPSDYVQCPHCRRNFSEHAAKRHIPFCQTQHERKPMPPPRQNQQHDRGRNLPPQHSSPPKKQFPNSGMNSNSYDGYSNGYNKHSNSAPMMTRNNHSDYKKPPSPPPPNKTNGGVWNSFRRFFGFGSKEEEEEEALPRNNHYGAENGYDDYGPPARRSDQRPVVMRTGRTLENTSLNVRARQKSEESNPYGRRAPPPARNHTQNQYSNGQYNSSRPTAVGRPPQSGVRCYECGNTYANSSSRFCPYCGTRR